FQWSSKVIVHYISPQTFTGAMYESSKLPTGRYFIGLRRPVTCRKTNSTRIRIVWHGEKVNGANFPEVIPQECSPASVTEAINERQTVGEARLMSRMCLDASVARPLIMRITIAGAFLALN